MNEKKPKKEKIWFCDFCDEEFNTEKKAQTHEDCCVQNPNSREGRLFESKKKSPWTALILSFLFVGLGQIYCNNLSRGILQIVLSLVLWSVFLGWIVWIYSFLDAHSCAQKFNYELQLEMEIENKQK